MTDTPKRTPLYDLHVELGGKMVDFAGWEMPVQYPMGIMGEHKQCREKAALFDVSHMGQVILRGDDIGAKLEKLCPQVFLTLPEGKARYGFFTNAEGGIMDDLIVSNAGEYFFVVVNAALRHQDIPHLAAHLDGVEVTEIFDRALVAVQGPSAEDVVGRLCPAARDLKFMETMLGEIDGVDCRISRLGYTGEDGYEISIPEGEAIRISRLFLAHEDCEPAGLGARDSLRLEAGLCLYGNDIDNGTSPIEASLLWAIQKRRREEGGFPGAGRILKEIAEGAPRKLVGIKPEGRAPARQHVEIQSLGGETIGEITSGGFGPTVGAPVAMGYVASAHAAPGEKVNLIIRGKAQPAEIVALPFVAQNYKR
ncbi:glycine cleavage system T protein (plasmid) [Ruegeria pomeroyi DSS-3]|jgi:aminomethyltransferase|uniref:aminomethyltransferase n=2 Tax=Ruegeria pomeroyi TaxID=89184 RepID=Q5LLH0_RUEPO|nr:glycine cleavage system aminomethyltransferase GcvT [Ruegeria pomeroyi]AAV97197.1 glycine cleavage system T protein [Ruegeria pomeroyi DSS-3]NVK95593.1 glycine cleavage system aminomethyltransferase GcvT [Ruegeria pomeroyi]NVL00348.1 glycine cleavage system aminomethyltransferase GcvT [Ruegeria pomeroyi]